MKIAAVQMVSGTAPERNLEAAGRLVAEAARAGAQLVALPEYFCLMGQRDTDKLGFAEAALDDPGPGGSASANGAGVTGAATAAPIQHFLSATARRHGVWLVGGTMPVAVPGRPDRVRNTCLVHAPDGRLVARYDKIHLFAYDNGRERYDEGRVLEAGSAPASFIAGAHRVGLSVCYDVRFPELYRALAFSPGAPPCDLMCVPSAFTWTTGQAHWELLLRARAVENQCYVLAPAQGGLHENGRRTWGHSLVVDPWGEVLACREEGEGVVLADIDSTRLAAVRQQLPALAHRRL
jgi:predicted amidohydrolase